MTRRPPKIASNDRPGFTPPPPREFYSDAATIGRDASNPPVNPDWWPSPAFGDRRKGRKRCPHCKGWLPFSAFRQDRTTRSWLSSWCRKCLAEATRDWRQRNSAEINAERRAAYREANPLEPRTCPECGETFTPKRTDAIICGKRRCKDRRYRRLHPEEYRAKQRRKAARLRERKR